MEVRNVKLNVAGTYDCEINHPVYGWIPFTANPDDASEVGRTVHADILAGKHGAIAPYVAPVVSNEQLIAQLTNAVQKHMDSEAKKYGYDDIKSAVTYAEEPSVPKFQAEGQAFRAWRSKCWAYCYDQMDKALAGTIPVPTQEELLTALPVLTVTYPA